MWKGRYPQGVWVVRGTGNIVKLGAGCICLPFLYTVHIYVIYIHLLYIF